MVGSCTWSWGIVAAEGVRTSAEGSSADDEAFEGVETPGIQTEGAAPRTSFGAFAFGKGPWVRRCFPQWRLEHHCTADFEKSAVARSHALLPVRQSRCTS